MRSTSDLADSKWSFQVVYQLICFILLSEYILFPEHARQCQNRCDVHRGPAGLLERRGQELLRRHEREAGLREGLRRPRRLLPPGSKKTQRRAKVRVG